MPLIPFPDVPQVPGVPPIPVSLLFPPSPGGVLSATMDTLDGGNLPATWGIYDSSGASLADSVLLPGSSANVSTNAVEFSMGTKIPYFPIQQGGFASYNKVQTPSNPIVILAMSGSDLDKSSFLDAIDTATKSTDLYSVVTPEVVYANFSFERYDYARHHDQGATVLVVEISLKEVREVSAQYSQTGQISTANAQLPDSKPSQPAGIVQSQPAPSPIPPSTNGLVGPPDPRDQTIVKAVQNRWQANGSY